MEQINQNGRLNLLLGILNKNEDDENSVDFELAKYFLDNYNKISKMNIYDVSQECYVDRSSIRRFCQMHGFDNFRKFKRHGLEDSDLFLLSNSNVENYCQYIITNIKDMVQEIEELYTKERIDSVAEKIYEADRVVILSSDTSCYMCGEFQRAMTIAGKIIRIVSNNLEDNRLLNSLCDKDFLMTISVTGYFAKETLNLIQTIKSDRLLLTTNHYENFEKYYGTIFYLSKNSYVRTRSVYSTYGLEIFLDMLFNEYMKKYYSQ